MKLWISTIWRNIVHYFERLATFPKQQLSPALPQQLQCQQQETIQKLQKRKKTRVYRFNSDDYSNASYIKSRSRYLKNKKILKMNKSIVHQPIRKAAPIIINRQVELDENTFGDLDNNISAITQRSADDSQQTIKQFLINLDPSCQNEIKRFKKTKKIFNRREPRQNKLDKYLEGANPTKMDNRILKYVQVQRGFKKMPRAVAIYEASKEQSIQNLAQKNKEVS